MEVTVQRTWGETYSYGREEIDLAQGDGIRIKQKNSEDFILDELVPQGKQWRAVITVQLFEKDAE